MAFSMGGRGRPRADINVTPMIDVLLVLLIIFMIIVPIDPVGFDARVPQPAGDGRASPDAPVVITVRSDSIVDVNQEPVAVSDLDARLRRVLEVRGDRVIFIGAADADLDFEPVARVIDIARGVGMTKVALMPR